ncbi:GIY-YIG nuclease family protein [Nocardioides bruguierae]|uniref:GIY-YIG nuclease family protein n=1 Tax=Nocardioides bruguierae TaxID=2945102 RepID=A0A9X2D4S0_9ACTN|nr:GIY-YIG nuclease family protein [Nocardioides bruguierae]MCL8026012.1 GIY-YIG nuclease family protein [Nocardioides bruguierae]MCM0619141.1 GIY-YIG nuclease family protein [Nocardioides bruguierae]
MSSPASSVLTFNHLLALAGVDAAQVRLVRHQDGRLRPGRLYEAWRQDRGAFERYQAVQSKDRFPLGGVLAGFVVTEARKTVFVGLYRVDGVSTRPDDSTDLVTGHDVSGFHDYELTLLDELADYRDRVVIDWGPGTRSWVQHAAKQPKTVVEIAEQYEPRFPGFREFVRPIEDIPTLPNGWQQVLRSVKGVYLLVDRDSGHQYVGSAKGADSLFGRWLQYATDGHGGNEGMKKAAAPGRRRYQVSVLEVVDENTPDTTIEQIESFWKNKLLSRIFGLNVN